MRGDREIVTRAIELDGSNLQHIIDDLKNDKQINIMAVEQDGCNLE